MADKSINALQHVGSYKMPTLLPVERRFVQNYHYRHTFSDVLSATSVRIIPQLGVVCVIGCDFVWCTLELNQN